MIFVVGGIFAMPAHSLADSNSSAISYLTSKPLNPWSIMALAAAGNSPSQASTSEVLASTPTSTAIGLEAPILAMTATGNDPRSAYGKNFLQYLENFYSTTTDQIGDPSTLNDDIFGLLALSSSGVAPSDPIIIGTRNFLLTNQNASDGGWSYSVGGSSDTNDTASAIMALLATGSHAADPAIQNAISYLASAQNLDGGFSYDPVSPYGTSTDASSDAWVMSAFIAAGQNPEASTTQSLLSLQDASSGFFAYQVGSGEDSFSTVTTSYALMALLGKYLPVNTIQPPSLPALPPVLPAVAQISVTVSSGGGMVSLPPPLIQQILTTTSTPVSNTTIGEVLGASTSVVTVSLVGLEKQLIALEFKTHHCSFAFNKDLFQGMDNYDIHYLQTVLNYSPITEIATGGPGALGHETSYFGLATKNAVMAFQKIFSDQILEPEGLALPNGYVGTSTREVLNDLCSSE
jgi:peptidoglycan hydrolase-like protein with peptidoglycan-binding domain